MKMLSAKILLIMICQGISFAHAYSTISEAIVKAYLASPLDLVPSTINTTDAKINLLKWNENPQDPPVPTERYNRLYHFGQWITLNQEPQDCVDVRNRVLMRESKTPVEMRANNRCKVGTGSWFDPYTDITFNRSEEVQIDHYVPLKDTYLNGAWKWNFQARCVYANYMGYRDHLKPVNGNENMIKSDKSPDGYMPPNPAYRCEYLKTWLSVKLIWQLGLQRAEALAIKQLIAEENCDPADFKFSKAELLSQRAYIQKMLPICSENSPFANVD